MLGPRRRIAGRAAARLRRSLGFDELTARLDAVQGRLDALEGSRFPSGPVYLGDHRALVATRWGAKMEVDTRDALLAPWLLLDGLWESHVTGWMHDTLKPGNVFVDAGANVGYFTLLGAKLVGSDGRVVAIEAHPATVEILRRNVVINGFRDRVAVWHRAAWSETADLKFHQRQHYAANSSLASVGPDGLAALGDSEVAVEVPAVALDDLLDGLPRVDVIKVDVEGAEVKALAGLARTLTANPHVTVLFEWSPEQLSQMGDRPRDLVDALTGHGFTLRLLEDDLAPVDAGRLLALPYGNVVATR